MICNILTKEAFQQFSLNNYKWTLVEMNQLMFIVHYLKIINYVQKTKKKVCLKNNLNWIC